MARRIKSRIKFSNVDILSFMGNVVQKHTKHYQSDFETDRKILTEAADRQEQQDKTFIWLCRTAGTWLLLERNTFLKDTREFNTFSFYAEQTSDLILAYVVEITGGAQDAECQGIPFDTGCHGQGAGEAQRGGTVLRCTGQTPERTRTYQIKGKSVSQAFYVRDADFLLCVMFFSLLTKKQFLVRMEKAT